VGGDFLMDFRSSSRISVIAFSEMEHGKLRMKNFGTSSGM
jgi:hypothetical protein